ncbi:MAG: hypothetical protein MUF59_00910 [Candidatus Krumholzibacteria bacterium]|nr:hypothetical protein [Candidatus Krumholzibacteria bacterium]
MRIYRTEMDGVAVLRISGVVRREDALMLLQSIGQSPASVRGSFILDFQGVEHVDYHVFVLFEEWFSSSPGVVMSGLSDYLLDIFAFVQRRNAIPIYPDWRKALNYLVVQRARLGEPLIAGMTAGS